MAVYIAQLIMKNNQNKDQDQSQNLEEIYKNQNQMLRKMHQQRMKARQKQSKDQPMISQQQQIDMKPSIKKMIFINQPDPKQKKTEDIDLSVKNLFLNTLYYDTRQTMPNCFIKFVSLFNQNPRIQSKTVSPNIQSVFITTFGFQTQTFQKIFSSGNIKLVVLNDSKQNGENKVIKQYSGIKNFTVILHAKKQQFGVSHTKLWLIKFKNFLRVVVCTSNQHIMDWAVWENAYWYQDFLPISKEQEIGKQDDKQQNKKQNFDFNKDFEQSLDQVLDSFISKAQLQQLTSIKISDYAFKNVKVVLIPSIPGRHNGQKMNKQGICKLKNIMSKFNKIPDPIVTYNSTSLGVFQAQFVSKLYSSFCPKAGLYQSGKLRLIYPTKRYIEQQTGGQAQVLFLTSQNLEKGVGKTIFYKFDTNPENNILGVIPHLKTAFVESSSQPKSKGILYVGSHNMTKAAWGKFQKKESQLYIANSQLGILIFDVDCQWYKKWAPFNHPPQPYKQNDIPFFRDFSVP